MNPPIKLAQPPAVLRHLGQGSVRLSFRLMTAVLLVFAIGKATPGTVMHQAYLGIAFAFVVVVDCLSAVFTGTPWPLGLRVLSVPEAALYVSLAVAAYVLYTAALSLVSMVLSLLWLALAGVRSGVKSA